MGEPEDPSQLPNKKELLKSLAREERLFVRPLLENKQVVQAFSGAALLSRHEEKEFERRNSDARSSSSMTSYSDASRLVVLPPKPAGPSSRRTENETQELIAQLSAKASTNVWRSCVALRAEGPNLITPDGSAIPIRDVEIEDPLGPKRASDF